MQLIVGHTHAFDPAVRAMRDIIVRGELGRLGMIASGTTPIFSIARAGRRIWTPRRRRHHVAPGAAPDRHRAAPGRRAGAQRTRQCPGARSSAAAEGACAALLEFEDGAAASLVYSGYDFFDSDEWHGIGERGAAKQPSHGAARRALAHGHDEARLRTETYADGAPAGMPAHQPHFGLTIVTCAWGDMRASADGLVIYDQGGMREVAISRGAGLPGRREVLDDMRAALRNGRRPLHDGRWGKANVEVALALLRSAREGREVTLAHQVGSRKPGLDAPRLNLWPVLGWVRTSADDLPALSDATHLRHPRLRLSAVQTEPLPPFRRSQFPALMT